MIKIYSADNLLMVEHVRALLAREGIATTIKNQYISGALGELPANECWPELWLVNESQRARAEALVAEYTAPAPAAPGWRCDGCGETIEGQFGQCWQCGRPAEPVGAG